MNDHAVLAEFVATRRPEALAELVARYEPLVHSAVMRQVGDSHLADDITQSTMMTLIAKAAKIRSNQPLGPWLLRVAHFLSIDALRSDSARRRHEQIAAGNRSELQEQAVAVVPNAINSALDRALNSMRERDRTILVLRYLQGWTFEQIAGELNISVIATRQRLSRAVARLRDILAEQGVRREDIFPVVLPALVAEINNSLASPPKFRSPLGRIIHGIRRCLTPWPLAAAVGLLIVVGGLAIARGVIHRSSAGYSIPSPIAPASGSQILQNSRPNSTIP